MRRPVKPEPSPGSGRDAYTPRPAGTELHATAADGLAEVRWLTLAEADELLVGMFEPVREHLGRVIS